jgi:hypothetical protein
VISTCILVPGCAISDEEDDETSEVVEKRKHLAPGQTRNFAGIAATYSLLGPMHEVMQTNAFFKNMGTTGRTCESCHGLDGGWTTSAADDLWDDSNGTDPLFMFTHDNGVCPDSDISTRHARRRAMVLTLERGSTRGNGRILPTAEFEATAIDDPYNCSGTTLTTFFGYRKPNPTIGVSQKTSVTWAPGPQPDMFTTLKGLVVGATQAHGLTTYVPTDEEQTQGAEFMLHSYFAQIEDEDAGRLDDDGARGGPVHLANQEWFVGINHASTGATTRKVFDIYDAWLTDNSWQRKKREKRRLIAQGQEIFNFRENANGGTCSGCHNSPNVGTRSVYQLFDIGAVDIDDDDLTRVTIRNKTTNEVRTVTNLGRAGATGLWSDVGKMAVPPLRGLASRGPYFNSGQAKTLKDVVEHYDARFNFNFTHQEKKALVAFLGAL